MPESSVNLLCPIFCTFYATENWHESVFVSIKKKNLILWALRRRAVRRWGWIVENKEHIFEEKTNAWFLGQGGRGWGWSGSSTQLSLNGLGGFYLELSPGNILSQCGFHSWQRKRTEVEWDWLCLGSDKTFLIMADIFSSQLRKTWNQILALSMSDGLTLFPVNGNNSDLYLVGKFTHLHTTDIERAQRKVMYRAVMYAWWAELPGLKETSGTKKDTSVFSLFWHHPPPHPSMEGYYMGFRWATCWLWSLSPSPTLFVIQKVGLYPAFIVRCWRLRGWWMLVSGTLFYSSNIWVHQRSEEIFKIPLPSQNWLMVQAVEIEWICLFG